MEQVQENTFPGISREHFFYKQYLGFSAMRDYYNISIGYFSTTYFRNHYSRQFRVICSRQAFPIFVALLLTSLIEIRSKTCRQQSYTRAKIEQANSHRSSGRSYHRTS